ncbi:MAG: membrane bound O-acyl transferase family-domain-containing protein [Pirellulales bacterium]|nr:membrane bound O-acyl transferase family-domain-containing protein [Pirellulales bacterium]
MLTTTARSALDVLFEPWQVMLTLALAIYAASKAATWWPARHRLGVLRSAAYLLAWPGMNPLPFTEVRVLSPAQPSELPLVLVKIACGVTLIAVATSPGLSTTPVAAGLLGLVGFVMLLHFGAFHLLAILWRRAGFDVKPIMNCPFAAKSLIDFWSRRWNLAFRDLAHHLVFRPLVGRATPLAALLTVFLVSGLIHDVVISGPVGSGYGLPTLYFVIQALGFLAQRTPASRRLGLATGIPGRVVTATFVLLPVPLLFHPQFLERVMLPLVAAIRSSIVV